MFPLVPPSRDCFLAFVQQVRVGCQRQGFNDLARYAEAVRACCVRNGYSVEAAEWLVRIQCAFWARSCTPVSRGIEDRAPILLALECPVLVAVLESPADDAPRFALADWLNERYAGHLGPFMSAALRYAHAGTAAERASAVRDLEALCRTGAPGEWLASVVCDRPPEVAPDVVCDPATGRVTARIGVMSARYERGLIAYVAVPLRVWCRVARTILECYPVERVDITDFPGMHINIVPPNGSQAEWELEVVYVGGAQPNRGSRTFATREELVANALQVSRLLCLTVLGCTVP